MKADHAISVVDRFGSRHIISFSLKHHSTVEIKFVSIPLSVK